MFLIKSVKADKYLNKNRFFLHKVGKILLNYAFLLFWSIFGEIHRKLFFLDIKVTKLRNEHWNSQKVCFSYHVWIGAKPVENLEIFKQFFLIKSVKRININKNCFYPQSKPITAKLCLSVVFKAFLEKFIENFSFYDIKWLSQKWALKYSENFFFLPCLKRGKSWGKFGFV